MEQDALIPIEQSARQKVAELYFGYWEESGSVLKAILQAKESNQIEGIYGRMGDLGAMDGKSFALLLVYNLCFLANFSRLTMTQVQFLWLVIDAFSYTCISTTVLVLGIQNNTCDLYELRLVFDVCEIVFGFITLPTLSNYCRV